MLAPGMPDGPRFPFQGSCAQLNLDRRDEISQIGSDDLRRTNVLPSLVAYTPQRHYVTLREEQARALFA